MVQTGSELLSIQITLQQITYTGEQESSGVKIIAQKSYVLVLALGIHITDKGAK